MAAGWLGGAEAAPGTAGRFCRPLSPSAGTQLPPPGQKPREMLASGPLGSTHTVDQRLSHLLQLARLS